MQPAFSSLSLHSLKLPDRICQSAWLEHAPFAFWLVDSLRPRTVVELGTYSGFSYCCFCQAIHEGAFKSRAWAIDTWQGDEHSGFFPDSVFDDLRQYHDARYGAFSTLVRATFDEASSRFENGSIDLLHIDGRHFYEDVRHDFETWRSKLSDRAVVLFHDTAVYERGFGVARFWREIAAHYPSFAFHHGHGLGVLAVGRNVPPPIREFCASPDQSTETIRAAYARLGRSISAALTEHDWQQRELALLAENAALNGRLLESQAVFEQLRETKRTVSKLLAAVSDAEAINVELRRRMSSSRFLFRESWKKIRNGPRDIGRKLRRKRHARPKPAPVPVTASPPSLAQNFALMGASEVGILATRHTAFVARLIANALRQIGIDSRIQLSEPEGGFASLPYFVVAAQVPERLPNAYVAFQMEQGQSDRWFTPAYIQRLNEGAAVLDYSSANIPHLVAKGVEKAKLFPVPLWVDRSALSEPDHQAEADAEFDVLFYGDVNSPRRANLLHEISRRFRVKVIRDSFGEALYHDLRRAKIVVNVHYHEDSPLETTRIFECLTYGRFIISERGSDQLEHLDLEGLVEFVDSIEDISLAIERYLSNEAERRKRVRANIAALSAFPDKFAFSFYRYLLAHGHMTFEKFCEVAGPHVRVQDRMCIALPETPERQLSFDAQNQFGFVRFPALRHARPWIGCGMSTKFLIRRALEAGMPQITICEDDIVFPAGWSERYKEIEAKLLSRSDWDVFVGLIADLADETEVSDVVPLSAGNLALLDAMTSTVFVTYRASSYPTILAWDENDHDMYRNTIDRIVGHKGALRVATCHPFLVGHRSDVVSTLWGNMGTYVPMIARSEAALGGKIQEFLEGPTNLALVGDGHPCGAATGPHAEQQH